MKNRIFAVTLTLATLVGCSAKAPDTPTPTSTIEPVTVEAKSTSELFARAKLTCKDASECPENVALLTAVTKVEGEMITYHACTSFLVAPDIVATNSHCLPLETRATGRSCKGKMAFLFASNGGEGTRVGCDSILSATEIAEDRNSRDYLRKIDVAFIKLASPIPNAASHAFDHNGLPDGMALRIVKISPLKKGGLEGSLEVRECNTVQGTYASPSYDNETAGIAMAAGCEIVVGNSGAPALDAEGKVRAIVFAVLPPERMRKDLSGFELPAEFQSLAYLSNASCFDAPRGVSTTGTRADDQLCSRRLTRESLRERARKTANLDIESTFESWKRSAPAIFGYKLNEMPTSANNSLTKPSVPAAICLKAPSTWPSAKELQNKLRKFDRDQDRVSVSVEVPVWAGVYALDELYRVSIRAKTIDRAVLDLEFDAKTLESGSTSVLYKVRSEGETLKSKSLTATLKLCPE